MTELPHVPVYTLMHDHVMVLTGVPAQKYHHDAKTLVDTTVEVAEYYRTDTWVAHLDNYNIEAEALGARMVYGEHSEPAIDFRDPLIKEPGDLLKLNTPDFYHDGRLLYALECFRLMKDKKKGRRSGTFCGPFSLAVALRSYPLLIKDIRKRPEFVRDLLTFCVDDVIIPYLRVQKEYSGVTSSGGVNAWASIPNLSPAEVKEWALPCSLLTTEKAREFGIEARSLVADYCEERLENFDAGVLHQAFDLQVASAGKPLLDLIMGRWQDYPLQPVLDYTAKYREQGIRVPVRIAINARVLRDGPVDRIVGLVKRFIDTFAREHELTISMHPPADTNPDHIHAAVAAVHTFGQKPVRENLDEIEFTPPRRESFTEWQKTRRAITE